MFLFVTDEEVFNAVRANSIVVLGFSVDEIMNQYREVQNMLSVHQSTGEAITERFDYDLIYAAMEIWEQVLHNNLSTLEQQVFRNMIGAALTAIERQLEQQNVRLEDVAVPVEQQIFAGVSRPVLPVQQVVQQRYVPGGGENDYHTFPHLRPPGWGQGQTQGARRRRQLRQQQEARYETHRNEIEIRRQREAQRQRETQRPRYPNEKPDKYLPLSVDEFKTLTSGRWHLKDIRYIDPKTKKKKAEVCCICKLPLKMNSLKIRLPCGHQKYHITCLIGWLKVANRCGICEAPVIGRITEEMMNRRHAAIISQNQARSVRQTHHQEERRQAAEAGTGQGEMSAIMIRNQTAGRGRRILEGIASINQAARQTGAAETVTSRGILPAMANRNQAAGEVVEGGPSRGRGRYLLQSFAGINGQVDTQQQ